MKDRIYNTVDELSDRAKASYESGGGNADSNLLLDSIIILSAVLSGLFFWHFSTVTFGGLHPFFAWLLATLAGLLPSEGAFFGWKLVREKNVNMTDKQISASSKGLMVAIGSSIFSTVALFVATFEYVPEAIKQLDVWLMFLAMAGPISIQSVLIGRYVINKRTIAQNHEMSKLSAMGFNAHIKAQQARVQSIIEGMQTALDVELKNYGNVTGQEEAQRLLNNSSQQLLNVGANAAASESPPLPTETRSNEQPPTRSENGQPPRVYRDENGRERDVNF